MHYVLFTAYHILTSWKRDAPCPRWYGILLACWAISGLICIPNAIHTDNIFLNGHHIPWIYLHVEITIMIVIISTNFDTHPFTVVQTGLAGVIYLMILEMFEPFIKDTNPYWVHIILYAYIGITYTWTPITMFICTHRHITKNLALRWAHTSAHERIHMIRNPKILGTYTQSLMQRTDPCAPE